MAAVEVHDTPELQEPEQRTYLNAGHTVSSWLLTVDHKRIGIMYLIGVTSFFLVGALFAALVRLELTTPAGDFLSADLYNKAFTTSG